jgi:hypothetical protein
LFDAGRTVSRSLVFIEHISVTHVDCGGSTHHKTIALKHKKLSSIFSFRPE